MTIDLRRVPARPDLAAAHLAGRIEADRFVEGERREVRVPRLALKKAPSFERPLESEALRGAFVTVFEETDEGWSWGQIERDGYVGWLPSEGLTVPGPKATHRVAALATLAYPGPSIKLPVSERFSLGSRLAIVAERDGFAETADRLFVFAAHLAPATEPEPDFVAVAERFLHVPYLWGGRSSYGLDCSGLVQIALEASGRDAPRDSDMQAAELGQPIEAGSSFEALRRGDLVFWKGHVGIMLDSTRLLHANGHHMAVAIEPLAEAVGRIAARSYGAVTGVRRIEDYRPPD